MAKPPVTPEEHGHHPAMLMVVLGLGKKKKKDGHRAEGGRAGRRLDRPARRHGGATPKEEGKGGHFYGAEFAAGGKTPDFHPGGEKGKLHRELGIPVDEKIPAKRLQEATHSRDPEVRRDAIRAETMKGWHHTGPKKK